MVPVSSAPAWAAPSTPRARPEATTTPRAPSSRARSPAKRKPTPDALRAPTMAQTGRASGSSGPLTEITGGAGASSNNRSGNSGSHAQMQARADRLQALKLRSGLGAGDRFLRLGAPAALRQAGQGLEGGGRLCVAFDQGVEGDRADA